MFRVAVGLVMGGLVCVGTARGQGFEAVGIRALGMGGAFVAVADDASATYWNPAGLVTGDLVSVVMETGVAQADALPAPSRLGGTLVALSKICTHEGATIEFRAGQNDFLCSNHGSQFNLDGSVKLSPAESALQVFKTELSGNSLTVKS